MTQKIAILFLVWVGLALLSLLIPAFIDPVGDGMMRGLNQMVPFFSFQGAAFLLSILIAFATFRGRGQLSVGVRILGYIPFVFGILVILMIAAIIFFVKQS